MMTFLSLFLPISFFALAYMIKGGQFPVRFGKALAAGIIFDFVLLDTGDIFFAMSMMVAWILAIAPSMGEEAGAIGRLGHWWGKYRLKGFSRSYGVLKGVQRGVWMGAVFTVAGATSLSIPILGVGFVAAHFIGQQIHHTLHNRDDWRYAEPIIGALIGLCYTITF